mgnify:CR=1 FL=1
MTDRVHHNYMRHAQCGCRTLPLHGEVPHRPYRPADKGRDRPEYGTGAAEYGACHPMAGRCKTLKGASRPNTDTDAVTCRIRRGHNGPMRGTDHGPIENSTVSPRFPNAPHARNAGKNVGRDYRHDIARLAYAGHTARNRTRIACGTLPNTANVIQPMHVHCRTRARTQSRTFDIADYGTHEPLTKRE